MNEREAALYEAPFQHVVEQVKPSRISNNRKSRAEKWWRHGEARPGCFPPPYGLPFVEPIGGYQAAAQTEQEAIVRGCNQADGGLLDKLVFSEAGQSYAQL